MSKHTPGPWHWDTDPYDDGRTRFQVVARGRTIAKTYYPDGDGQAKADTVLMAAAPDLLDALQMAKHIVANEGTDAQMAQVFAAIEKATGEKA